MYKKNYRITRRGVKKKRLGKITHSISGSNLLKNNCSHIDFFILVPDLCICKNGSQYYKEVSMIMFFFSKKLV